MGYLATPGALRVLAGLLVLLIPAASAGADGPGNENIRWFELQSATLYSRYRYVESSAGVTTANQMQHKESFRGRLKLDKRGRLTLNAGIFSGRQFIGSWNNSGWGTGDAQSNLAVKQLFLAAVPWKGLVLEYGGLYLQRGESSEITSYDDDGYIVGERISIKRPDRFFLDEISVTYAYLGDTTNPNLNKRFHRLKQSNYHQFLVAKKFGKRIGASLDYTLQDGSETLREAVKLSAPEMRVLDTVRFENYQRVDVRPDYGFALYGEKLLVRRLTLGGGYAQIDPNYGNLNADRFLTGKRIFLMVNFQIFPELAVAPYLTRGVGNRSPVAQRIRLDLVLNYNLLKSLQRTGLLP
ncbi:MAG TPA: hypothetical protein VE398_11945 [Acidobacteriota bacterium]|nr:hypothetical protein [Acidobacteriota bacterium]